VQKKCHTSVLSYYRKNRLRVFEKWLLTKALVYNKKEVTGEWRKIA
jgi:hypothetical protein